MFCEKECHRKTLQKIVNNIENKTHNINNNDNNNSNTDKKQITDLPWLPKIRPEIKKEIQKFAFRVALQTAPNLNNILCKNKNKVIPNIHPGVYELKCSCGSVYDGAMKKKIIIRSITDNQQESIKSNCSCSGATEHKKEGHGRFDWLHPKTLSIKISCCDRKLRESLEIYMTIVRYGQDNMLNRDNGNFFKTMREKLCSGK